MPIRYSATSTAPQISRIASFSIARRLRWAGTSSATKCKKCWQPSIGSSHEAERAGKRPIGVTGYGEGGLLALYAAALDPRIDAALVSGYFDSRQNVWQEPIYRNVFGLLDQFGDAELASLVAPRA